VVHGSLNGLVVRMTIWAKSIEMADQRIKNGGSGQSISTLSLKQKNKNCVKYLSLRFILNKF